MLLPLAVGAWGEAAPLSPQIAPLGFLIGNWTGEDGRAGKDRATGTFRIAAAAGGQALLREDHSQLLGAKSGPPRTFDQIMLVYPDNGQLRADYFDGTHAIHYEAVEVDPGSSARFSTPPRPDAPAFRLTYTKLDAMRLSIKFEMEPPGQTQYRTLAEGTARKN